MAEPAAAMPEPEPAASPPTVPTCPDCNMAPPCQCERTTTPTALLADEAAAEQPQPAEADDDADAAGSEEEDDFVVDIAVPTQDGTVEHKKFNVHRNETIGNAKRRMSISMGLDPAQLAMLVGDTEVDEDDTVADLGIADGSMLELSNEDEFVDEEDDFGVSVEVLNSETGVVEEKKFSVSAGETIGSVKRRMSVSMGLTPEQMEMLMGTQTGEETVDDDKTVAEVGLTAGAKVALTSHEMAAAHKDLAGKLVKLSLDLESGRIEQAVYDQQVGALRQQGQADGGAVPAPAPATVEDQLRALAGKLQLDAMALATRLKDNDFDKAATVSAMQFELDGGEKSMIGGGGAAVGGGETAGRAGWARIESKAKNWTRRWLRLDTDGAYFKVFGDDSEADLLASIPVEFCKATLPKTSRDDAPFAFRIDVETSQTFSHCGWMTKAGEGRLGRRSFKRRWFQMQLQGTELAYFDGPGGALKGRVDLTSCQTVQTDDQNHLMVRLAYSTFDKRREYEFTCDDEDGCMMWVNALMRALTVIQIGLEKDMMSGDKQSRDIVIGKEFKTKYVIEPYPAAAPVGPATAGEQTAWIAAFGGMVSRSKMDQLKSAIAL